ncbi:MAG TPA: DNA primase, partial [Candidatus Eisenbacteria bacterium]
PGGGADGPDAWVERVRAASDIVEIVSQSVPLRRVGRNLMGRCPFHEEKSPSFSVSPERQFYHCFGCKAGGDVFKFVQETEKVGFLEAVELLSRRAGIPIPERRSGERGKRAPLFEALDAAATAYEQWLGDPSLGAAARALLEERGISRETQREFRLGLALPGWENLVQRLRGRWNDEVLLEARLAGRKEGGRSTFDWFRNRLMIPLVAPGGAVLGFGARALGEETPKYLNSPESTVFHKGQFLFGLEHARRAVKPDGEMVVVEGYFDAIALHQAGVRNTVATSGTALTADHARTLRRLVRGVALTYDGDAAGQQAMLRSLGVLLAEGLDVVVVELPAGDDPDTLVRRAGHPGWCTVRDSAYDAVEFVHRHVLRTTAGGDPREQALQVVVRLLAGVTDAIRHRLLVERASQVFGVAEGVIARAARLATGGDRSGGPMAAAVRAQRRVESELERRLLLGLWHAPELIEAARAELDAAEFEDGGARALAEVWWERGVVMPGDDDGEAAAVARELAAAGGEDQDHRAEVIGTLRRLVVRRLQRELRRRQSTLAAARGEDATRLMQEIQDIARTLHKLST